MEPIFLGMYRKDGYIYEAIYLQAGAFENNRPQSILQNKGTHISG